MSLAICSSSQGRAGAGTWACLLPKAAGKSCNKCHLPWVKLQGVGWRWRSARLSACPPAIALPGKNPWPSVPQRKLSPSPPPGDSPRLG